MPELQIDDRVSWKTAYCPRAFGHVLSTHGLLIVNVRSDSGLRLTLPRCIVTREDAA